MVATRCGITSVNASRRQPVRLPRMRPSGLFDMTAFSVLGFMTIRRLVELAGPQARYSFLLGMWLLFLLAHTHRPKVDFVIGTLKASLQRHNHT